MNQLTYKLNCSLIRNDRSFRFIRLYTSKVMVWLIFLAIVFLELFVLIHSVAPVREPRTDQPHIINQTRILHQHNTMRASLNGSAMLRMVSLRCDYVLD